MGKIQVRVQNMDIYQNELDKCKDCNAVFDPNWQGYLERRLVCKSCYQVRMRKHREENIIKLMKSAGIPPRFLEIVTDKDITAYIKGEKGLYVWGRAGTGKTIMACSIGRQLIIEGCEVKFISSPKFIIQLQNIYRQEGKTIDSILDEISGIEVLILDDIGAEKLTDFVRQTFYYIINEREQWLRKTIITSNYSLDELDERIDSRISSRIAGTCEIVELSGQDRRIEK